MAKKEVKVDDIEEIGKSLPKSKQTEDFIKKAESSSKVKKKDKIPTKVISTKSGIKIKTKADPEEAKPLVPPPETVRVTIPAGEIVYLYPDQLINIQHQPREMHKKVPPVDPEFVKELESAGGNLQAVLAQRVKRGSKPVVIDGHRRVWAIAEINEDRKPEERLKVKVELVDVNDAEASVMAYRLNINAERLSESERDRWVFEMLMTYGMTPKQIRETTGLARATVSNIRRVFSEAPEAVLKAVDEGEITTGHAKAIVSLPPKTQENLIKKAIKRQDRDDPMPVREMESEAKTARNIESIISLIIAHVEKNYIKKQKTPVYLDVDDYEAFRSELFVTVFPNGTSVRFGVFTDGVQETKRAMTRAGLRLRERPRKPDAKPKVSICVGCVAFVKESNRCLWTALKPDVKPPVFDKCPMNMAGQPVSQYTIAACPYCKHPIWDSKLSGAYPQTGNVTIHTPEEFSATFVDPELDTRHIAHAWCLIQEFVRVNRLEGVCSDCSQDNCDLIGALSRMRSLEDHHTVSKCPLQRAGFNLEKLNAMVISDWEERRNEQLAEIQAEVDRLKKVEEAKAKAKEEAEAKKEQEKLEKAKAKEKADAKKKADAKAEKKTTKSRKKVKDAKAESKARKEVEPKKKT